MFSSYVAGEPSAYSAYFSLNKTTAEVRVLQPISRDLHQAFTLVIKVNYRNIRLIHPLIVALLESALHLLNSFEISLHVHSVPAHRINVTAQCSVVIMTKCVCSKLLSTFRHTQSYKDC